MTTTPIRFNPIGHVAALICTLLLLAHPIVSPAGTTLDGSLYFQHASGMQRQVGDFVGSNTAGTVSGLRGLNRPYIFWIEVPPTATNLTVEIFDSDFGSGGDTNEGTAGTANRDRRVGAYNSSVRYRLTPPTGAATTVTRTSGSGADNGWDTIADVANPVDGHWQLEVDSSSAITTGDDINAFGVRAFDDGPDDVELNVYAESYLAMGINAIAGNPTRTYIQYPYITSGCDCYVRDFDADDADASTNSTVAVVSRNLAFSSATTNMISDDDEWRQTTYSGWADDGGPAAGAIADGYGPWRLTLVDDGIETANSNYIPFYVASFNSPGAPFTGGNVGYAPTAQPELNTFRIYLPRDGSTLASPQAPLKPYLRQYINSYLSGSNPPVNAQNTFARLRVDVVNPTPHAITFSATNLVTINVPAQRIQYQGSSATPSQGTVVSQPANDGNGNITWNPGTVAANTTANITYRIRIRPTGTGQTTNLTGIPAGNPTTGTRATYVDETGNTTQARATFTFGPLCQLSIVSGAGGTVLSVEILDFSTSTLEDGRVLVEWDTANEIANAGFEIYEAVVDQTGAPTMGDKLTTTIIPSGGDGAHSYSWIDDRPWKSGDQRGYYLTDIDFSSTVTTHGPVWVGVSGPNATIGDWNRY